MKFDHVHETTICIRKDKGFDEKEVIEELIRTRITKKKRISIAQHPIFVLEDQIQRVRNSTMIIKNHVKNNKEQLLLDTFLLSEVCYKMIV